MNSVITGIGSYIPTEIKKNIDFIDNQFYDENNTPYNATNEVIIEKFKAITGISERRYVKANLLSSDIATIAAQKAIDSSGIDSEELDYIIFAQNFGDVKKDSIQSDLLPSLASRVKQNLKIKNSNCVAYDIIFGCPGWVQGLIQAEIYIKAGEAKKCLVIGSETLSRVIDDYDRNSMIFSDGAGACILEAKEDVDNGILSHTVISDTIEEAKYLYFGKSYKPNSDENVRYIKMLGRKIYEYSLTKVPNAMKKALEKSGASIDDVKKIFIHQANEKMDEAIVKRFFRLYKTDVPTNVMPMSINKLGNSSVATIPTLLDLVIKGNLEGHSLQKGDIIIIASVGAGMNINAVVYKY
ncbi:ketoacyl-ACP synthase III [Aureibaculum marinum]|uniref:Ketoacyl-ACP synthase III n=1 Tax=Aureibaculum marinum TaxID=2487930 RepID=A0A3N4P0F1_9FLAO|nr:ketoacyl-ACP synthase III [Aureibaculum marinum]RPD99928.1 ketoacyl-ACP synthase III [Aureibaculum marinum]